MSEETDLRIIVARIEGMLTATLARHDQRLDQHENTLDQHGARLNEKGKLLARHDERLQDLEDDNSARWGRVTGVIALLISAGSVLYAILTP
ncbi:hypothetical protein ACWGR3_30595 [Streptomyces albidoflavus]